MAKNKFPVNVCSLWAKLLVELGHPASLPQRSTQNSVDGQIPHQESPFFAWASDLLALGPLSPFRYEGAAKPSLSAAALP